MVRRPVTLALAAGLSLVLAACGGSQPPAGSSQPPASQPSGGGAPAPTPTTAPQAQQQPPQRQDAPAFASVMGAGKQATYKATYKFQMAGAQPVSGEQTVYMQPQRMRWDMNVAGIGPAGPSIFLLEDASYMCSSMTGQQACLRMPLAQAAGQGGPGIEVQDSLQERPDDFETTYQGTRQLAGQTGHCYEVKPKRGDDFEQATTCVTTDGIPLLMTVKAKDGQMTMEATNVSKAVSDADFRLPAPVADMPAIPGIPGGQLPPGAGPGR